MSHLADYVDRNLFDAGGHTLSTYYNRIVRRVDSHIWNPTSKLVLPVESITWAESVTILQEEGTTGVFPVIISKDLPAHTYDVIVYKQLGSVPQNTDDIERQFELKQGSIFGF
jgi:hypothetical protein